MCCLQRTAPSWCSGTRTCSAAPSTPSTSGMACTLPPILRMSRKGVGRCSPTWCLEKKKILQVHDWTPVGLVVSGNHTLSFFHLAPASPDEWIVGGKICRQHFLNKHLTCKGYKLQEHWIGTFLNFLTLKSSYERTDWIHFCTYSNHTGMHYKLQRNWISLFLKLIYASENFELFLKIDFFTTYSLA